MKTQDIKRGKTYVMSYRHDTSTGWDADRMTAGRGIVEQVNVKVSDRYAIQDRTYGPVAPDARIIKGGGGVLFHREGHPERRFITPARYVTTVEEEEAKTAARVAASEATHVDRDRRIRDDVRTAASGAMRNLASVRASLLTLSTVTTDDTAALNDLAAAIDALGRVASRGD